MGDVILPPEVAYVRYTRDLGMDALIVWFRAELEHCDEATQVRFGALPDARLYEYQDHTEHLAKRWRAARRSQAQSDIASVA
jgi:hypothetical protein